MKTFETVGEETESISAKQGGNAPQRSPAWQHWGRSLVWLAALGGILAATGCATSNPPHITAKVIYQHEDVAAELSSEWHR
jgi:hypothetical protein